MPLITMTPQHSHITSLPKELVDNIASWLPTRDFNALRLTCKDVESKSFKYWSECFFKKRQFMIDQFSLQTLVDISQHAALSRHMTHLIIGLDELEACHLLPGVESLTEFTQWRDASCAQKALLYGGGAADLLSRALSNLPELKSIDIRDFNSSTRYRDVIPGQDVPCWRSYGSSQYQQWPHETDSLVRVSNLMTNFVDTVFMVVLAAVGRSSTAVKNLEVILRNRHFCLRDEAFSTFCIPGTPLASVLPALTKLHLDLDTRAATGWRQKPASLNIPQHAWVDINTEYLRRFLALTPNVSWLRLNFPHPSRQNIYLSPSSKLIQWLSLRSDFNAPPDAPWGQGNPAPVTLPLRRLDLGFLKTDFVVMRRLLKKFAGLEHIVMREIQLEIPVGTPLQDDYSTDCLWARLIRSLNVTNPKLENLELQHVQEDWMGNLVRIVFVDKHDQVEICHSTSTKFDDITTIDDLADHTWTTTHWEEVVFAHEDSGSEDEDTAHTIHGHESESGDVDESEDEEME